MRPSHLLARTVPGLACRPVATDPPPDLVLAPLLGQSRTVAEWLTMFHMLLIVLDPYTEESSWILPAARRIIGTFEQADCRVAILIAADERDARQFLGPLAVETLTFPDPDRTAVKALGLERLPAIVHLDLACSVVGAAEGWNPSEWRTVCNRLGSMMAWSAPAIPLERDPGPFAGSPALG